MGMKAIEIILSTKVDLFIMLCLLEKVGTTREY